MADRTTHQSAGVIDGDTITVRLDGARYTVRLTGVDTRPRRGTRREAWSRTAPRACQSIYHREDVKFSVKFLGAGVSLEVTDTTARASRLAR